jgi:hypothetical protein
MEIRELTIGQINEYVKGWASSNEKPQTNPTETEENVDMFNLASGIPVIKKK